MPTFVHALISNGVLRTSNSSFGFYSYRCLPGSCHMNSRVTQRSPLINYTLGKEPWVLLTLDSKFSLISARQLHPSFTSDQAESGQCELFTGDGIVPRICDGNESCLRVKMQILIVGKAE